MDCLETFLNELYTYLTGKPNDKTNIVRLHTRKLQECGELSFPLHINSWCSLVGKNEVKNGTIFKFLNPDEDDNINKLISTSQSWILRIDKCEIVNNNLVMYLNRATTFESVIRTVLNKNVEFGSNSMCKNLNIIVDCDASSTDSSENLSELRLKLLTQVSKNLIIFSEGVIVDKQSNPDFCVNFSLKSSSDSKTCLCGPVLNKNGVKDVITTSDDFYKYLLLTLYVTQIYLLVVLQTTYFRYEINGRT